MKKLFCIILGILVTCFFIFLLFNLDGASNIIEDLTKKEVEQEEVIPTYQEENEEQELVEQELDEEKLDEELELEELDEEINLEQ